MRIKYDLETDILNIKLKDTPVVDSEYIEGEGIVLDYDEKDNVVAIEILGLGKFKYDFKRCKR